MLLEVRRKWLSPKTTIGELYIDGLFFCFTLEDFRREPGEPKVPGETCIPEGDYELLIGWSDRFQRDMPRVQNVPGFKGILLHWGNFPKDTLGCVLVGLSRGTDEIGESRKAFAALFEKLVAARDAGESMRLKVTLAADRAVC